MKKFNPFKMDFEVMFEPEYDLYPVAIFQSRYSGVYEGGKWFAIGNFKSFEEIGISEYLFGDDCDAVDFWMSGESEMIGVGSTPDAAVENLYERYRVKGGPTQTSLDL
jgi:hypothetical protein